jgi:hypothetical protein
VTGGGVGRGNTDERRGEERDCADRT